MNELSVIRETNVLGNSFNVYGTPDEPLFLAKDVAEWIDHSNITHMMNVVDDEEKLTYTIVNSGQNREMWFLTEDGLYEVLMQSRKPIAKTFKKEVKKILKDIRKHGVHATDEMIENMLTDPDVMIKTLTALKDERAKVKKLSAQMYEKDRKLDKFRALQNMNEMMRSSDIGALYGLTGGEFNRVMHEAGIIKRVDAHKKNKYWMLTKPYIGTRYLQVITEHNNGGTFKSNVWTPDSLEFIDDVMTKYGYEMVI